MSNEDHTNDFGITGTLDNIKEEKTQEINDDKSKKENNDLLDFKETNKVKEELNKTKTLVDIYHIAEFMSLLELLVKADKIKTEISIDLDLKTRECFLHIIKNNPEFFSDFEKIFMLILEDNKIDIDDIPHITKLITKLYIILHNLKEKKLKDDEKLSMSSTILKFIIQVLVKENKINIGNFETQIFLEKIEELIDSCVNLIKLNGTLGVKHCCCVFKYL
jgi:hypothetical protein